MQRQLGRHWFHMTPEEVARILDVEVDTGLDLFEVKHRTELFRSEPLEPQAQTKGAVTRFLLQFNKPADLYPAVAAAVITVLLKEYVDAAVILAVVLINAVIGYLQECKAEQAIEALAKTMVTEATVVRAGHEQCGSAAASWCRATSCCWKPATRVPADLRLLAAATCRSTRRR